jgi:propionyl-CoA carboxylase alpha chain
MFYDPMIAKLCTHAPTRMEAVDAMADALDRFEVEGIGHNLPFLSALMQHPRWREGRLSTGFIAEEYPDGFGPVPPNEIVVERFAIAALVLTHILGERNSWITGARFSQTEKRAHEDKVVMIAGHEINGHIDDAQGGYEIKLPGRQAIQVETDWMPGDKLAIFSIDGDTQAIKVEPADAGWRLRQLGVDVKAQVFSPRVAELARLMPEKIAPDTSNLLLCPMPGLIVSIAVSEGDEVQEGQTLAVVEAMKMENVLKAERKGTVASIPVKAGDSLAVDEIIMEFAK